MPADFVLGVMQDTGDRLLEELTKSEPANVIVELDWTESITHPDEHVEWELWTSSNDGCGPACDSQGAFKRSFRETAVQLEQVCPRCCRQAESHHCQLLRPSCCLPAPRCSQPPVPCQ